jgi:hypothetical protein
MLKRNSGVSEYNNKEVLHKFSTKIEGDDLFVDAFEVDAYLVNSPQSPATTPLPR